MFFKFLYFINGFVIAMAVLYGLGSYTHELLGNYTYSYCTHGGPAEGVGFVFLLSAPFYVLHLLFCFFIKANSKLSKAIKISIIFLYPISFFVGILPCNYFFK
jgi:hypothetical protein